MPAKARLGLCCLLLVPAWACRENDRFEDFRAGARPLHGADAAARLRGAFEGTYDGAPFGLCLDQGGRARGRIADRYDTGSHRTTPEGLLCLRWQRWGAGVEVCTQYYVLGADYLAYDNLSGKRVTRARKVSDARCAPPAASVPTSAPAL